MRKYHDCDMCSKENGRIYGFKLGISLGHEIRICGECYSSIPLHIPRDQIKRYVRRLIRGRGAKILR